MSMGPLAAFFLLFGLAGLGIFLADRLFRSRGQAFLRSYALHLALWNSHALVLVMQFILGPAGVRHGTGHPPPGRRQHEFPDRLCLPGRRASSWPSRSPSGPPWPFTTSSRPVTGPSRPAAPAARPPRSTRWPSWRSRRRRSSAQWGICSPGAGRCGTRAEGLALRLVAGAYVAGFLAFQLCVAGVIPVHLLSGHDYYIAVVQIGFHFPVLAALVMRGYSNREIGAELFISLDTVKKHLSSVYQKARVKNRLQLGLLERRPPASTISIRLK